jgi:murein L,D-transpeptidase YafK
MSKLLACILLAVPAFLALAKARAQADGDDFQKLPGDERIALARKARGQIIRKKFEDAGVAYPPREIFLRWFKRERVIELWARSGTTTHVLVATYEILKSSGAPGPKRREGDLQVPEGFYEIDRFNPESLFHLSLGLNYPNASDRILSDREKPGGDIFIHGKDVTTGCGPIGDEAIEELYLAALDTRSAGSQRIDVHIFPARMMGAEWDAFARDQIARNPALEPFWRQLKPAHDAFETTRRVPKIEVTADGEYHVILDR